VVFSPEWQQNLYTFLAVLSRVASFWVALPILRRGVPLLAKVGMAGLISLLLLPVTAPLPVPESLIRFAFTIVRESLFGLLLGFLVALVFSTLYLAGQLIDVQMGFGAVTLFDPQTGDHVPMVAQFQNALAVLLFFLTDGHHALFAALGQSFLIVPLSGAVLSDRAIQHVFDLFVSMFVLSLRIALPVMAAVFLTDVALGIITRAVPQMNVFVIGFPVKIAVGLAIYLLALPAIVSLLTSLVGPGGRLSEGVGGVLPLLGGGP